MLFFLVSFSGSVKGHSLQSLSFPIKIRMFLSLTALVFLSDNCGEGTDRIVCFPQYTRIYISVRPPGIQGMIVDQNPAPCKVL